ncbi:MAG: hypothetical protein Q8O76_00285 [Chloroflexota bacterium]|nr:hypothetical protein [Chloroflexota bacterium]
MKPEQVVDPSQGTRAITAERKRAVAQERARITGQRVKRPSAWEELATQWEKEREAMARKAQEEKLRISHPVETFSLPLQQVRLAAKGTEEETGEGWKAYTPQREKRSSLAGRMNMAGVCGLSRRLMALERARALGRKPLDLRGWALEQAARAWAEGRKGIRGDPHK